jgi:hypothetical protein
MSIWPRVADNKKGRVTYRGTTHSYGQWSVRSWKNLGLRPEFVSQFGMQMYSKEGKVELQLVAMLMEPALISTSVIPERRTNQKGGNELLIYTNHLERTSSFIGKVEGGERLHWSAIMAQSKILRRKKV